ncbi:MAG: nuclear transport factor 2 family protein [Lautropia sp.]|nr:nuclear transport factor 2 family protein [Lautropia sp.]
MDDFQRIYHQWHEYARDRDTERLIALYAEDAVFESPLVPVLMGTANGVLRGRRQILAFLEEGTRRRPNELVRWYRSGQYLVSGDTLVWEYPRQTPDRDQVDILELMQVSDGQIRCHRIYWGWFGTQMLLENARRQERDRSGRP